MRKVAFSLAMALAGVLILLSTPAAGADTLIDRVPPSPGPVAHPKVALNHHNSPPHEVDLGGETLREYCQAKGYDGASQSGGPTGWTCYRNNPAASIPLSLTQACRWQFADMVAAGFYLYDTSGHCKTFATESFRISDLSALPQYCQSLGYRDVTLIAHDVASWRCVTYQGTLVTFDMHAACRWVNPGYVSAGYTVVSYFYSYGDAFGITCVANLQ